MLRILRIWLAVAAVSALLASQSLAAGNLYVLQIGDGTDANHLSGTGLAAPVVINKFADTGGSVLGSVAMPTTSSGSNSLFAVRGNSTTESFLHLSTNGQYLVMGGVAAAPLSTLPGSFPKVVGRLDINNFTTAGVNTSTVFSDGFTGNSFRSVASTNGTDFWMSGAGTGGGIRYTTLGSTTSSLVGSTTSNTRVVSIFNDASNQPQLYTTSGTAAFLGLSTVGTGLPTTTGNTIALLPGTPAAGDTSTNPMDFWFQDATTFYKANGDGNSPGIAKYTFNSGNSQWELQYILDASPTTTSGAGGLTGVVSGGTTTLYATNYSAELVSIVDTGASSTATVLATAPANTLFRGVVFVPSAPAGVQGDYNNNGIVDAADYVLWRNGGPLLNDPTAGVQATDYDFWRSRFGANTGSGSGAAVPEPTGAVLLLIGVMTLGWRRRAA